MTQIAPWESVNFKSTKQLRKKGQTKLLANIIEKFLKPDLVLSFDMMQVNTEQVKFWCSSYFQCFMKKSYWMNIVPKTGHILFNFES